MAGVVRLCMRRACIDNSEAGTRIDDVASAVVRDRAASEFGLDAVNPPDPE